MKKLVLTIAIVLGMTLGASAQMYSSNNNAPQGGGLFQKGANPDRTSTGSGTPLLPSLGQDGNQDAQNGPIGSGALLLIGFGAAYAMSKKRKK